ncbi:1-acyl-sn-glycerol-3-phosphate acyltransferase alpha-like [Branchiostoma floridae x Branchiostoma belcheri]
MTESSQTKTKMAVAELEVLHYGIIAILLILPVLYETSATFKYFAKFVLYDTIVMCIAVFLMPVLAFRPRDVNNYRIVSWVVKNIMKIFAIKIDIKHKERLVSDQPYILVSNHQSSLDFIGMMELLPDRCAFLAKRELLWAGPFGISSWLCGTIFIDRLNPEKARDTMDQTAEILHTKNIKLWIFPEGTRNHNGSMLPFKKGAFYLAVQAQIPIVPVVFSSFSHFYNKKERKFETGRVTATVLPPVSTEGLTKDDVTDLTEQVRKVMLQTFNETSLPRMEPNGYS